MKAIKKQSRFFYLPGMVGMYTFTTVSLVPDPTNLLATVDNPPRPVQDTTLTNDGEESCCKDKGKSTTT
jgi:hypothetical protein